MVKVSYSTGLHDPFCVVSNECFVSYLMSAPDNIYK